MTWGRSVLCATFIAPPFHRYSSNTKVLLHVLFIPKWWPNANDPQLGDFLRKQALAAASRTKVSVLHVHADKRPAARYGTVVSEEAGLWEVTSSYPASEMGFGPLRKMVNLFRYRTAALRGWERLTLERGKPDLVHVHIMVRPALLALWIKRRSRVPYIISEQSSEYLDGKYAGKSAAFKMLSKAVFRRASAVVAVSPFLGDALVAHGLCNEYKVVPNVIPGLDRPLPPPGSPGHFLVVADLVDRTKNVSGVLRAMAQARKQEQRIQLTVIGDGPDRAALEQLTGDLGISDSVTFLGRLANRNVLDRMAHAASVIINSNVETFSVVTGEALAQGKPVIATRCGGPMAFVTPENGLLINTRDDDALARAMVDMTQNADRYSAASIRDSVNSRSSPEAVGRTLLELYTAIVASTDA